MRLDLVSLNDRLYRVWLHHRDRGRHAAAKRILWAWIAWAERRIRVAK